MWENVRGNIMKLETQRLVANNIRMLRTSKCISQAVFAKMINISRATYASYELGNRAPDAETLFLIARNFGLSMNIFFECDRYKFLGYLESCEFYDEELKTLISNYKNLSSFAKGMLLERSDSLMEWDRMIAANRKALNERLNKED